MMKYINKIKSFLYEYRITVFIVLMILIIRSVFFNYYLIPSGSMYPTLKIGDYVFVNRVAYAIHPPLISKKINYQITTPKRGDVVVFYAPNNEVMIKRVVGLPGDTVRVVNDQLYINGVKMAHNQISEEFSNDHSFPLKDIQRLTREDLGDNNKYNILTINNQDFLNNKDAYNDISWRDRTITANKNEVILLGDNRDNSLDSRFWGALPIDKIIGKMISSL